MPDFGRLLLAALIGAGFVFGAQQFFQGRTVQLQNGNPVPLDSAAFETKEFRLSPTELAAQLSELRRTQQQLQSELLALRQQLVEAPRDGTTIALADAPSSATARNNRTRPQSAALTLERLTASGIADDEAESLVQRLDELALARLTADYRVRQSAGNNDQHRSARAERRLIPRDADAIREEFGDTAYDSYLYASGQPNRVEVASVLRSSAAVDVGVQSGDVLRSLDGKPLYSVRDLTARVREGSPDQTYALSIERNGQMLEVWVPGGPLGVRVSGASVSPNMR